MVMQHCDLTPFLFCALFPCVLFVVPLLPCPNVVDRLKSPHFCAGQQKKKKMLKKEQVKRTATSGHVNRLIVLQAIP